MSKYDWNNTDNVICTRCGITKTNSDKLPAVATGIEHPDYAYTTSFYLYGASQSDSDCTQILCPRCHRECQLELVHEAMDKYAEKHGENNLARICGVGR